MTYYFFQWEVCFYLWLIELPSECISFIFRNIEKANLSIEELKAGLQNVDETVQQLQEHLRITTKEGAEIEVHLSEVQNRINAAESLVKKLNDEFTIWTVEVIVFCFYLKFIFILEHLVS